MSSRVSWDERTHWQPILLPSPDSMMSCALGSVLESKSSRWKLSSQAPNYRSTLGLIASR